jgi:hypothetical protein
VDIGDDLATQNGPYISQDMFRELVKPYFREVGIHMTPVTPICSIQTHGTVSEYADGF